MFTGIIEQQGAVLANISMKNANRLEIESPFQDLKTGESIAVNGVCLTLLPEHNGSLMFDVSPETVNLTTLGHLKKGDKVNLERAMQANTRFGGHYVSGHVDTTASLKSATTIGEFQEVVIGDFAACASMYLLPKGSITLDGVSLTINAVTDGNIKLMLVPHTLAQTTLGQVAVGQRLNVEFDYLTRIVAHQLKISGQLNNDNRIGPYVNIC
ncbi:riboflavin synthase [Legionella micdadei]|uniref:Riboflavin synthase n=1 Tax=Legionella micdadei TaxID=451 RepID=A0A098GGY6_LEGMI|nr:riboflavin synthase [Legionella micdadei]ARG97292.1 riboflavin synthase [Legionella micdadei]ARH00402.1 riboflavin synthase [Legionella micdadei]KTD28171.1 riboflavin synthase alpha chain [Legionella micdadei]NSL16801.1 riboflavin synthase [Legionella micdadei]CEG61242.1 Riboflavin synthase alpha chain [Legionella micdadei]